jgi:hypothetical protein
MDVVRRRGADELGARLANLVAQALHEPPGTAVGRHLRPGRFGTLDLGSVPFFEALGVRAAARINALALLPRCRPLVTHVGDDLQESVERLLRRGRWEVLYQLEYDFDRILLGRPAGERLQHRLAEHSVLNLAGVL